MAFIYVIYQSSPMIRGVLSCLNSLSVAFTRKYMSFPHLRSHDSRYISWMSRSTRVLNSNTRISLRSKRSETFGYNGAPRAHERSPLPKKI